VAKSESISPVSHRRRSVSSTAPTVSSWMLCVRASSPSTSSTADCRSAGTSDKSNTALGRVAAALGNQIIGPFDGGSGGQHAVTDRQSVERRGRLLLHKLPRCVVWANAPAKLRKDHIRVKSKASQSKNIGSFSVRYT